MFISAENMFKPYIKYIPYGTIGYVKTINNDVRQCKCLGGKSKLKREDIGEHVIEYEWKVAGYKEHFFTFCPSRLEIGIIYVDEMSAQRGSADINGASKIGELVKNDVFPIFHHLINKYGMSVDCFRLSGTWNQCFSVSTYAKFKNNTTGLVSTDFQVIIDKSGIDCVIPMLDGSVNGIHRYPTAEKAYAAMKPLPVYNLDDEDDEPQNIVTKVKVTIEIEQCKLDKIKEIATIL